MPLTRKISTRIADISLDNDGVITITMKDEDCVDEYDILDINLIIRHLSNHQPALKLFDSRSNWRISPKAQKLALQNSILSETKARAVVVSSKLNQHISSFIRQFENHTYPQKYFTDLQEAKEWLLQFKES